MADTGFVIAGAGATGGGAGVAWSNPGNITADDGSNASYVGNGTPSEWLEATQFGFAIPDGATIDGFEIRVQLSASTEYFVFADTVQLMKAGSLAGSAFGGGLNWTTSPTDTDFGGATELGGTTWTPAEVNASGFGVSFRNPDTFLSPGVTHNVDAIWIKVYYTEASGVTATGTLKAGASVISAAAYRAAKAASTMQAQSASFGGVSWPNGQRRRVAQVVQSAQVSGSGTHSSFPVLITRANLPDEMCSPTDGNRAQANGGDIRAALASDASGQLPIQVVAFEYDTTDAAGDADIEIWTRLTLNTATDTTFYLAYNTPGTTVADGVADAFGRNAVWADYACVYHMQATGSQVDATGNGHTLTEAGDPTSVAGLLGLSGGNAIDLDGTGDKYTASTNPRGNSSFVFQCLFTAADVGDGQGLADDLASSAGGFHTLVNNTGDLRTRIDDSGANSGEFSAATTVDDETPRMVHMVADKSGVARHYVNGSAVGGTLNISGYGDISPTENLNIGQFVTSKNLNGIMDEIRIRESVLSADWIATEFANQNSPATFIVEGTPEDATIPAEATRTAFAQGTPKAQAATLDGSAKGAPQEAVGILASGPATVEGEALALRVLTAEGALASGLADMAGAASRTAKAEGVLASGPATLLGQATIFVQGIAVGVMKAGAAALGGGEETDTGFVIAGAGANDSGIGTEAWAFEGNITADDAPGSGSTAGCATVSDVSGPQSWYLVSSEHGFSIPAGATIQGIVARVDAFAFDAFPTNITHVYLVKGGTVQTGGDNKAGPTLLPDGTAANYDFGGSTDLWDNTWTADDVNADGFGVAISVLGVDGAAGEGTIARVDAMWVDIYYSTVGPATAIVLRKLFASGALQAGASVVDGAAKRVLAAIGALQAGASTVAGAAGLVRKASGAIASGAASMTGTAVRAAIASGTLVSGAASIVGRMVINIIRPSLAVQSSMSDAATAVEGEMADALPIQSRMSDEALALEVEFLP